MKRLFPLLTIALLALTFSVSTALAGSCGGCDSEKKESKEAETESSNS